MRKFLTRTFAFVLAATFGLTFATVAATYTQTLLTDGSNIWALVSSNSSAVSQASLQLNGVTALTFDTTAGPIPPITTVSALPTCNTARKGAVSVVTDASSPTYGGSLTGSSTTVTLVMCNGTAWVSH